MRDIKGYEGLYSISDTGQIWCYPKRNKREGSFMKTREIYGYTYVNLTKNGKVSGKRVHRLVAENYLENPNGYDIVGHIDNNKSNNNVSNLEWCTQSHNIQKSFDEGRKFVNERGMKHCLTMSMAKRKLSYDDALMARKLKEHYGWTTKELARLYELTKTTMRDLLIYKTYTSERC